MTSREFLARRWNIILLVVFWLAILLGVLIPLTSRLPPESRVTAARPYTRERKVAPSARNKVTSALEPTSPVGEADFEYLAARKLLIPVAGVLANQLHDTFNQARGDARQHKALDIMAPEGTPVLATSDGMVLKLFQSVNGGITLYQLDPSSRYAFYYAHLMRYAEGIAEGMELRRGDVIGYVGDTGNAGTGNFHLHFGISKLVSSRKWSGGEPINPYPLLVAT